MRLRLVFAAALTAAGAASTLAAPQPHTGKPLPALADPERAMVAAVKARQVAAVGEVTRSHRRKKRRPRPESSAVPPTETATAATARASAPRSVPTGSVWDRLAACESSGNWHINSTFDGGLQFAPSTWTSFGGGRYAPYAWQATRSEQIAIAVKVQRAQGWGAWPVCSVKIGVR